MSVWPTVKLSALATFRNGLNFAANARGKGLAIVGVRDFQDRSFVRYDDLEELNPDALSSRDSLIAKNDIIFVRSNGNRELIGRSLFVAEAPPKPTSHSGFTIRLRFTDQRALPQFFAYQLRGEIVRKLLSSRGGGTNINNLSQGILGDLDVTLPPLWEQARIAEILGAYDDLIEVNRRRVALLEEMSSSLFEEWFVRFRFPGHDGQAVTDEKGPLPPGWTWAAFSTLADFLNGYAFKPSDFQSDGLPIVKIPELKNGVSSKTPLNDGKNVPARLHLNTGDLLFSWSGTLAVSEWTGGAALLNQHLFRVQPKIHWHRGFIRQALRSALVRFDSQGVGATMKHIRRAALDDTYVAVPPVGPLSLTADRMFSKFYDQIIVVRQQMQILAASRDLLLPRLISGKLSVAEAERELAQAA